MLAVGLLKRDTCVMTKVLRSILILSFLPMLVAPAQAATKSDLLLQALSKFNSSAKENYTKSAELSAAKYQPKIASSELRIKNAVAALKNANQITVIKLGTNRGYWGQFNCPQNRTDCIAVDKGPEFKVGEVTTIKNEVLENLDQLYVMELILKDGLIELKQPNIYLNAVSEFRDANTQMKADMQLFEDEVSTARQSLLLAQDKSEAIRVGKLAAKRAQKSNDFNEAFVTAFVFEYNRVGLDKYASIPFSDINSIKALNNTIELSKLSRQADQISASYSFSAARNFNRICSNLFTSEPDFKQDFKFVAEIFKKTFKKSISLK